MKPTAFVLGLLCFAFPGNPRIHAVEARAAVYVVDRDDEFAGAGGACLPYSTREKTTASREILAIAEGPAGSTLFMIAFDREYPHLGLGPVIAAQGKEPKPVRFPAEGAPWPFRTFSRPVDLYVAIFDSADPELAELAASAGWLTDALKQKDEVNVLLHAEAIRARLAVLVRRGRVEDYRVNYGEELTSLRQPPSSKAGVTRSHKPDPVSNGAKRANPGVHRGLKTLEAEWRQDARVIPFAAPSPGLLIFPITTPIAL